MVMMMKMLEKVEIPPAMIPVEFPPPIFADKGYDKGYRDPQP
jgi:hypothetical protein